MPSKAKEKPAKVSAKDGTKPKKGRKGSIRATEDLVHEAEDLVAASLQERLQTEALVIDCRSGHLGMTICNHPLGVVVTATDPADLAYRAGLRTGDVLVTVNETRVTDHSAAARLMFDATTGQHIWDSLALTYYSAATCERFLLKRRRLANLCSLDTSQGHVGITLTSHPLGLLVCDINPSDLAYQAGIRAGAVLVTLNGHAVLDHREAVDVISACTERLRLSYYDPLAAAIELVCTGSSGFGSLLHIEATATSHSLLTRGIDLPQGRLGGDTPTSSTPSGTPKGGTPIGGTPKSSRRSNASAEPSARPEVEAATRRSGASDLETGAEPAGPKPTASPVAPGQATGTAEAAAPDPEAPVPPLEMQAGSSDLLPRGRDKRVPGMPLLSKAPTAAAPPPREGREGSSAASGTLDVSSAFDGDPSSFFDDELSAIQDDCWEPTLGRAREDDTHQGGRKRVSPSAINIALPATSFAKIPAA